MKPARASNAQNWYIGFEEASKAGLFRRVQKVSCRSANPFWWRMESLYNSATGRAPELSHHLLQGKIGHSPCVKLEHWNNGGFFTVVVHSSVKCQGIRGGGGLGTVHSSSDQACVVFFANCCSAIS